MYSINNHSVNNTEQIVYLSLSSRYFSFGKKKYICPRQARYGPRNRAERDSNIMKPRLYIVYMLCMLYSLYIAYSHRHINASISCLKFHIICGNIYYSYVIYMTYVNNCPVHMYVYYSYTRGVLGFTGSNTLSDKRNPLADENLDVYII